MSLGWMGLAVAVLVVRSLPKALHGWLCWERKWGLGECIGTREDKKLIADQKVAYI